MNKFVITIEETVGKDFEIVAESAEQAMQIAVNKYQNGEFVLEPGEVLFKQMAITKPNSEVSEWCEF